MSGSKNTALCLLPLVEAAACGTAMVTPMPHANADARDSTDPYAASDIYRALGVMGPFVTMDDDLYLTVNGTAALLDPGISALHVTIAHDYALHNNAMIGAMHGSLGRVNELEPGNSELAAAVEDFVGGKFRNFINRGDPDQSAMSVVTASHPIRSGHDAARAGGPFGMYGHVPAYHGLPGTVCGGSGDDPHKEPPERPVGSFLTKAAAILDLLDAGYHKVPLYATGLQQFGGNYGNDYAKTASAYGCNSGEFRDQVVIKPSGSTYYHNTQGPEPNPEVFSYPMPVWWWAGYVLAWHWAN
ncbi:MAG: hypothetical protein MPJ06_08925 [Nitrosopumilus sp.]|nr:hypothetical protein [Nitrosopumilus sp.]